MTSHHHNRFPTILTHCLIMHGCWAQCTIPTISTAPRFDSHQCRLTKKKELCDGHVGLHLEAHGNRLSRSSEPKSQPENGDSSQIKKASLAPTYRRCLSVTQRLQPECGESRSTKANQCQGGSGESPGPPYLT